jgi:hypothetical protein
MDQIIDQLLTLPQNEVLDKFIEILTISDYNIENVLYNYFESGIIDMFALDYYIYEKNQRLVHVFDYDDILFCLKNHEMYIKINLIDYFLHNVTIEDLAINLYDDDIEEEYLLLLFGYVYTMINSQIDIKIALKD